MLLRAFLMDESRPLFSLFSSFQHRFNSVDSTYILRCLDSNLGSLVLEATALPTEPQPPPKVRSFKMKIGSKKSIEAKQVCYLFSISRLVPRLVSFCSPTRWLDWSKSEPDKGAPVHLHGDKTNYDKVSTEKEVRQPACVFSITSSLVALETGDCKIDWVRQNAFHDES